MKNKSYLLLMLTVTIILIIVYHENKQWKSANKLYAVAFVKGKHSGAGPSSDTYSYIVNRKSYYGDKYNLKQEHSYIVTFSAENKEVHLLEIEIPINPNLLLPQPPEGWTECPINEDGTIKEKYKRSNDPWYLKKARYVVGEAMDTSMRYIYRFKWRYASVSNVEIGKHYMLKINADNLKQYELASTVPIDTAKLQIQTNGGWEECPVTKEGVIKDKFKK